MLRISRASITAGAAGLIVLHAWAAEAETLTVTKAGTDTGTCTATPCRTISYAAQVAEDGDTINVGYGLYEEPGGVTVTRDISIVGAGSLFGTLVTSKGTGSVFEVQSGATASLSKMMIFGGNAFDGGGIWNAGWLTVTSVVVKANTAASSGGGIYNRGTLTLSAVTITHNTGGMGGGLFSEGLGEYVLIADSRILTNHSTLPLRTPGSGAGIAHTGGAALLMVRTAVAWNDGNGIVSSSSSSAVLTEVTVSGNAGTGLIMSGTPTSLVHVTVADNTLGTKPGIAFGLESVSSISIINSIVTRNGGWGPVNCNLAGPVAVSHSVLGDVSCEAVWPSPTNLIGVDAKLAPLAYHGGFTPIHQLLPGSPAIDAANNAACSGPDQNNVSRPLDGDGDGVARCDMGASEFVPPGSQRGSRSAPDRGR